MGTTHLKSLQSHLIRITIYRHWWINTYMNDALYVGELRCPYHPSRPPPTSPPHPCRPPSLAHLYVCVEHLTKWDECRQGFGFLRFSNGILGFSKSPYLSVTEISINKKKEHKSKVESGCEEDLWATDHKQSERAGVGRVGGGRWWRWWWRGTSNPTQNSIWPKPI